MREAVQKAIDRETYAKAVYSNDYPVVQSVYEATTPYFKSEKSKLAYDPAGAAKLLDKAGWTLGSDGYRAKGGKRLTLVLNLFEKETTGDLLLQDQLRKAA